MEHLSNRIMGMRKKDKSPPAIRPQTRSQTDTQKATVASEELERLWVQAAEEKQKAEQEREPAVREQTVREQADREREETLQKREAARLDKLKKEHGVRALEAYTERLHEMLAEVGGRCEIAKLDAVKRPAEVGRQSLKAILLANPGIFILEEHISTGCVVQLRRAAESSSGSSSSSKLSLDEALQAHTYHLLLATGRWGEARTYHLILTAGSYLPPTTCCRPVGQGPYLPPTCITSLTAGSYLSPTTY